MSYFKTMACLLKGTPDASESGRTAHLQRHCLLNVLIFGLIYGISAVFLSKPILAAAGQTIETATMIKTVMAGASIAFLMHAGASLFFWVFFKAVGGGIPFNLLYFKIGQASISLWPLAPFLAALQSGIRHPVLTTALILFSGYGLMITYRQILAMSGLSRIKLGMAFVLAFVYITCFLYLWL